MRPPGRSAPGRSAPGRSALGTHPRAGRRDAPAWTLLALGLAVAAGVTLVYLSWYDRVAPGITLSGWFQGDLPTYVCYARMALESPTTLSYASPHDLRPDPPPLLVNLPISVIGWLLAAGVPPGGIGHVLRLSLAPLVYLSLGLLLRRLFRPGVWFWSAFLLVGLGGGFAWLAAAFEVDPFASFWATRWEAAVHRIQSPYYWWFLDLFRNVAYPLELAYHAIVLAQLWALAGRRWGVSVAFHALACLSNPFAGIQSSGVQLGTLALARLSDGPPPTRALLASLAVAAAFVSYYALLLPTDPAIASVQEQHQRELATPLGASSLLIGYGPALLAPLTLLDGAFRRQTWQHFALVPLFVLGLVTLLLTQNSRLLPPEHALQPMHFSRGWLHVALWPIALAWLQHRARRPTLRRPLAAVAVALALLTLPDSALFVEDLYEDPPHRSSLRWDRNYEQVHAWLRAEPPRRVLADSWMLGRQICALHPQHRSAMGTSHTTPHYAARRAEIRAFVRDPRREGAMLRWADLMIVGTDQGGWLHAARQSDRWRAALCNPRWCVFRRVSAAGQPHGNSED